MPHFVAAYAALPGTGGAAGDRRDVYQIAATVAELVEEDLGRCHRAEQIDLHHPSGLVALGAAERAQQHHPGVVDQQISAAELLMDPVCGRDQGTTVGHVRSDGGRGWTQLGGQLLQAVHPPGQQRQTVAVCGKGPRGRCADTRRRAGDHRYRTGVLLLGQLNHLLFYLCMATGKRCSSVGEGGLGDVDGRHGSGPAGVEGEVDDHFLELGLAQPIRLRPQ